MADKQSISSTARSGSTKVDAFLAKLDHPHKAAIEALRAVILNVDPRIREEVKWNAPSFFITEHFATFKLHPSNTIQVVFHTGAKVKPNAGAVAVEDPEGILTWPAKDRCVATLSDLQDVESRGAAFAKIVRQWIERTSVAAP